MSDKVLEMNWNDKFKQLTEDLKHKEEENICLREELIKYRTQTQTQQLFEQQIQCLNHFKQQIIQSLSDIPDINSLIDLNNESKNVLIGKN